MPNLEKDTKIRLQTTFRLCGNHIIENGLRGDHAEVRVHRARYGSFPWVTATPS